MAHTHDFCAKTYFYITINNHMFQLGDITPEKFYSDVISQKYCTFIIILNSLMIYL